MENTRGKYAGFTYLKKQVYFIHLKALSMYLQNNIYEVYVYIINHQAMT